MEIDGYILTRQWVEGADGTRLVFWCYTPSGPVEVSIIGRDSVFFVAQHDIAKIGRFLGGIAHWQQRPVNLLSFDHESVCAIYFRSQRYLMEARRLLERAGITTLEADVRPTDRYLMERFVTGPVRLDGVAESLGSHRVVINPRMKPGQLEPVLRVVSLDIETSYTENILYSIAVLTDDQTRVFMVREGVTSIPYLHYFKNETQVIQAFLDWMDETDPDLIIGWSVVNFDLDFLQSRCNALNIELRMGRAGNAIVWRRGGPTGNRLYALVPGRVVLDGIELLRNANYRFESFSLETVARELLGRGKLVEDVDQRAEEIQDMYRSDPEALAAYNLEDCRLVWDIFAKTQLIAFALQRGRLTGLDIDRPGGSVAAFDFLYLPRLHRAGYVAPTLLAEQTGKSSPGGYVLDSSPGIYSNVIVLDFKSLYPSIIRSFCVDPLAMVQGLRESDADTVPGFRGGRFSRKVSLLPAIIEDLWKARDRAKASGDEPMSQAIKIIMNSFYGVLGTTGCRFYDHRLVSSITLRGHEILQKTRDLIEAEGFSVIYGDTDSVFVWIEGDDTERSVDAVGRRLVVTLNEWWRQHLASRYDRRSYLELEYETHYLKFVMPRIRGSEHGSKKRYAGLVSKPGMPPQLVFKGLESVRSDWSDLAKNFQQKLYLLVFQDRPYQQFIRDTVHSVLDGKRDHELVLKKRIRRKLGDYTRNIPPHVQAARKAESIRAQKGLRSMFEHGGWIEYIMTSAGPEPRLYSQSPIDYEFYIEHQLVPIADAILNFYSDSVAKLLDKQLGLF